MKARYAGLVWDFSEKVTNEKPDPSIGRTYIDAAIEVAERGLHKDKMATMEMLKWGLQIALSINDTERIGKLANTVIRYEAQIAEDNYPETWGYAYELLIKDKKVKQKIGSETEKKIIKDLEDRFKRLLAGNNLHATKFAMTCLVDYYKRKGGHEKVKEILRDYGQVIFKKVSNEEIDATLGLRYLEELFKLYKGHGMDEKDISEVSKMLSDVGQKVIAALHPISVTVQIPQEILDEMEKYIQSLKSGTYQEALLRIAADFIIRKQYVEQQVKDLKKKHISMLFTQKLIDEDGRPTATITPKIDEDIDDSLVVLYTAQNMYFTWFLLRKALESVVRYFQLSEDDITEYLSLSPLFRDDTQEFIKTGIRHYLNGNYIEALHILVPQIEAVIRKLAALLRIPTHKLSPYGGLFYRTLDDLLMDEKMKDALGEDLWLNLRVLLTDSRGINLRNNICHGIVKVKGLNQVVADRVVHALLCLSFIGEFGKK